MEQPPPKSVSAKNSSTSSDESTPEGGESATQPVKRDRFLWGVLPVALVLVVSAFFVSEGAKSQNDVQLGAPFYIRR